MNLDRLSYVRGTVIIRNFPEPNSRKCRYSRWNESHELILYSHTSLTSITQIQFSLSLPTLCNPANDIPTPLCRTKSGHLYLSVFSEYHQGSRMVQGLPELSTYHKVSPLPSNLKKASRTSAPAHHSASSTHTTLWSLLAANTGGHSRLADTKSDDFRVCAIERSKRRCRWVREPGTVSYVVSAGVSGETDSIHLAPERVDDHTNSLVARNCVVGVANVKLDCHGDLALIAGEVPAVERNICGFH